MANLLYRLADRLRLRAYKRRMTAQHALGRRGEDIAHRYLQRTGMVVVSRNYRTSTGSAEIDLVGWDNGTLVFVEVKSRQTDEHGAPDRAVGPEKWHHINRAARDYVRRVNIPCQNVRFDIVNIVFSSPPEVTHLRDVLPRSVNKTLQAL